MKHAIYLTAVFFPSIVLAKSFDRPMPQAQSATAEFWFSIASIALVLAMVAVGWLVSRR